MKSEKIGWLVVKVIVVCMLIWFLYPRITLPRYIIDGNTLTYKNNVYAGRNYAGEEEIYFDGKTIGIAVHKGSKRILGDFIFVEWVKEYKDGEKDNSICIRTFMGPVEVYENLSK